MTEAHEGETVERTPPDGGRPPTSHAAEPTGPPVGRPRRQAQADSATPEGVAPFHGEGIVNLDWAGTGVFVATATAGAIAPDPFRAPSVVVSLALFAIGIAVFLWAYGVAVSRSRYEKVTIGGVYFLGTAPRIVRVRLGIAFAVQLVAAITTASLRLYTTQAFAALAPMFGLGLAGLWGARYGTFPERKPGEK